MFGVLADVALISEFSGNRTAYQNLMIASATICMHSRSRKHVYVHIVAMGIHVHVCLLYFVHRR